jgi:NADPH-dependent glutamate synthase beta subunit-like oxidoreductase
VLQAGHLVTVYERNERVGGLLRYGIPTMKLEKDVSTGSAHLISMKNVEIHIDE